VSDAHFAAAAGIVPVGCTARDHSKAALRIGLVDGNAEDSIGSAHADRSCARAPQAREHCDRILCVNRRVSHNPSLGSVPTTFGD